MKQRDLDRQTDPVVFLHGFLESPAIWQGTRDGLARSGQHSFAPPLPGHRADAVGGDAARALFADQMALADHMADRIRDLSGGAPVRLVGHSLGGLVALCVAQRHPSLVKDVLTVGALHDGGASGAPSLATWLICETPVLGAWAARALFRNWVGDPDRFRDWMVGSLAPGEKLVTETETLRQDMAQADPDLLLDIAIWLRAQNIYACLGGIERPVTSLILARDPIVPPEQQLDLVRALPRGVAQLLDCGHLPMLSAPERLDRAILAWIQDGTSPMAPLANWTPAGPAGALSGAVRKAGSASALA